MSRVTAAHPMVRFVHVAAGYGRVPVFRDLSLSLTPGESVCLLGKNGCGKSTVLRSVLGLADILSGTVEFDGTDVRAIARSAFARLGVAYVPQRRGDFPSLTVEENMRLAVLCSVHMFPRRAVEHVFDAFPFIAALRSRQIGQLSGGERTLVSLARALVLRPRLRLLLLDEVSAGLSPANVQCVRTILMRVRQEGTTILMAEQNMAFATSLAFPLFEPLWQAVCPEEEVS